MLLKRFKYQKNEKLGWILKSSLIFAIFFIICDRFLKLLAIDDYFNQPIKIVGGFFQLNFVSNYNIAFSLPFNELWLNITIVLIIFALIFYLLYLLLKGEYNKAGPLLIIVFGAISNLFDRIKYGYVVDYFDLKYFTVFNLADVMIVGGVIGLGWLMIQGNNN